MKSKEKVVGFGVVGVSLLIIYLCFRAFSFPMDEKGFERLEDGMTKQEIEEIVGKPTTIHHITEWHYDKILVFGYVNIYFDDDERLTGKNFERF